MNAVDNSTFCPNCHGGHFRPCQVCGDTGRISMIVPAALLSAEQLDRIETAAAAYERTPEIRCQVAMANIYKIAGLLPMDLPIPTGDRDWARSQGCSLIEPWVEGCGYFTRIDAIEPGALLGFRLGHTLHHVAIALARGRMAHVFGEHGVRIAPCMPTEWAKRLERTWRIRT